MEVQVKSFDALTVMELYAILRLRSAVFVVEQTCIYQDVDDKDQKALHVIGSKDGTLVAYTRIFAAGDYFKESSIGRLVVADSERQHGYGRDIMIASINAIDAHFKTKTIHVSAQTYLQKFYNSLGFEQVGAPYLEDGLPHMGMLKRGS